MFLYSKSDFELLTEYSDLMMSYHVYILRVIQCQIACFLSKRYATPNTRTPPLQDLMIGFVEYFKYQLRGVITVAAYSRLERGNLISKANKFHERFSNYI
jgi:hypothetical protein